ncbi:MAG: protein translocase subunit SecF [Candidatus Gastranaerophilales bacterium]|nr:protein translocase subunit SecF [Candidatus Gastranaerophilales bacterium]
MFETKTKIIDVIKYKWWCIAITSLLVIPGVIAMIYLTMTTGSPLRLGIDYTGGTIVQYNIQKEVTQDDVTKLTEDLSKAGVNSPVVQKLQSESKDHKNKIKNIVSIRTTFLDEATQKEEVSKIHQVVTKDLGKSDLLQTSSVGPTLSKELFKNSFLALILAFAAIVAYLTMRFHLDYAVFALLALLHDALFVCGVFAIMGILYGVQIDGLFITAILTVVGFSVHDTIVVYDRIRENVRYLGKKHSFVEIVNMSVNQTLARSINTSLTSVITLLALYFFGGVTTKEFVLAMALGIVIGTYSSIFFASMLLADHRKNMPALKKA